jgi:hypothetical protein
MQRMRQKSALRQGRLIPILLAAGAGYLAGSWNAQVVHSTPGASAAQTVALRFPQDLNNAQPQPQRAVLASTNSLATPGAELALFEPEPMVPHPATAPAPLAESAAAEPSPPPPAPAAVAVAAPAKPALAGAAKPHPAVAHATSRPGYLLDDAQLASIKRRLHLTPEQEQMWPAVESALRQVAFAKARDAHHHGGGNIDPNSAEVQDLKYAAIPLLMSFSSEQKDEVRNLAHVMGLDQLASQF